MRWALLLRGVNVGKGNALPMADLRVMLEELGCTEVRTYIQSGNAVFASRRHAGPLTKGIEAALEAKMGRAIDTTLRTRDELRAVVTANPFPEIEDPTRLVVTFLSEPPSNADLAPVLDADWGDERIRVVGREIYCALPNGQARSPLATALGKLKLRGTVTTRNWRTVSVLTEMLDAT